MPSRIVDFPENLYEVLGVEPSASADEIRRAGRKRQRDSHPDLGGSPEEFTRVRLALEVLTDATHRADHDLWLATTYGIIAPPRPGTVRLRRQAREDAAPPKARTPRSPEQPAAANTTAGSTEKPGASIPDQKVDPRRFAWFRRNWDEPVQVWPGSKPNKPPVTKRELLTVSPMLIVGLVVVALLALPGTGVTSPWWPFAGALVALGAFWIWKRTRARRPVLTLALFWLMIAGLALGAAIAFLDSIVGLTPGNAEPLAASVARGVAALLLCGLASLAWWGLRPRNRRMALERLLMRLADESAPAANSTQQVYGSPGVTALAHSGPGVNVVRRKLAEEHVGEQIELLTRIPGVRIVHGVRLPGGDDTVATVSAAVLAGRRLAVIDTELRRPGEYAVDARGAVTRDGVPVSGSTEFPHRVERMHAYFGDVAEVRGWLTFVPERAGEFGVDNSRTWARVRLATTESLLREVGDWLAEDGVRVDRLLLRDLLDLRVTP